MTERKRTGCEPPAPENPPRRLLGQVLVDGGFVSPKDLERALAEQNRTNELLGAVLIRLGLADPAEIAAVVSIQSDLASLDRAVRVAAGVRQCLGELLLAARKITPRQLDEALREQRRTGQRLGEILVRRGLLTEKQLQATLSFQRAQTGEPPASMRLRLGEILVTTGQISRAQLDAVLAQQKVRKEKIGDLLVETGAAKPHQVAGGLRLQTKLVAAALVAVLSLAEAAGAQDALSRKLPSPSATAQIRVSATILPRVSLRVLYQQPVLTIRPEDVARGFVEAAAASRIAVQDNSPKGYLLVFERTGGPERPVERVSIRGLGTEIEVDPEGGFVARPHAAGPLSAELTYRFSLSPDARPGTYPWPLSLSVRPL